MQTYETLKHTTWECKYHVVFIAKCRKKTLYGQIRRELGPVFRELARQKECEIIEGHLMVDHVHMLLSIPPKYSVGQVLGFLKGKTAIHIARVYAGRRGGCGAAVLGAWLLGVHGGTGRSRGASLHPGTRKKRSTAGSTNADAALSGSRYLKPPALPEVADCWVPKLLVELASDRQMHTDRLDYLLHPTETTLGRDPNFH